jgi:hypothetical protein
MKVKFLKEKLDLLGLQSKEKVVLEQEYSIYGIEIKNNITWFYIALNSNSFYPSVLESHFFKITDSSLSRSWRIKVSENNVKILHPDWLDAPNFMRYFVEGDIEIDPSFYKLYSFQHYKSIIDLELR